MCLTVSPTLEPSLVRTSASGDLPVLFLLALALEFPLGSREPCSASTIAYSRLLVDHPLQLSSSLNLAHVKSTPPPGTTFPSASPLTALFTPCTTSVSLLVPIATVASFP